MKFKKSTSTRSGFTLIELLVVIAIIAVLAAILFPVFASAREKARQSTCESNEKQIGLAFTQYFQDYDEFYPPSVTERYAPQGAYAAPGVNSSCVGTNYVDNAQDAANYSIRAILNPYIKANGVWHDPSDPANWTWDGPSSPYPATETAATDNLASKKAWFLSDYGFNFDEGVWGDYGLYQGKAATGLNGYGQSLSTGPTQGAAGTCVPHTVDFQPGGVFNGFGFSGQTNLAKVTAPATFILGADTSRGAGSLVPTPTAGALSISRGSVTAQAFIDPSGTPYSFGSAGPIYDGTQASVIVRHSGGADFIFSDGHVKWMHPEDTWNTTGTVNYWKRNQ